MEKILIVDDSIVQATQLKAILEDEYDVTVAQRAEDGLRWASDENFSLILLDVVMPEMDGFTLLKTLQEKLVTQNVPVILITSLADAVNEQRGLVLGAVDYITKPYIPLIVKARVNTHVKLYRYRRQIGKCQGLNAEKTKKLFCAIFTKAIPPPQSRPSGQAPAAPARHTFPQGCRAGIHLPTAGPVAHLLPLFR